MSTVRDIVQIGHPVLREPARPVTAEELASEEIQRLIDDLVATMRAANGAGLAANQIAVPLQICAVEVSDNPRYPYKPNIPLTILVNPVLEPIGDETFENYEGCLSVPNLRGVVERHLRLKVTALDRHGEPIEMEAAGLKAGTFQHEVDHLRGVLFVDRVADPKTLTTWEQFKLHHEAAFVERISALVARVGQ